jgi:hypothetical protein
MRYIEAPQEYDGDETVVFLAGSVTDAENWQSRVAQLLRHVNVTLLNPRRGDFPVGDALAAERQIEWEHRYLRRAELVAFWFSAHSLCPIALFELGACCAERVPLVVATDQNYERRRDVISQLQLRRPEVTVVQSLESLAQHVTEHPLLRG